MADNSAYVPSALDGLNVRDRVYHMTLSGDGDTDNVPVGARCVYITATVASGEVAIAILPQPNVMPGEHIYLNLVSVTGAGEVKVGYGFAGGTDAVGDNFSANADYALVYSTGKTWLAVKETTT